jgi:hypothetical protein
VTSVGVVTIDPPAAADPRAVAVATMLDRYFTGINDRDIGSALSAFDPAGVVNPGDQSEVDAFARAVSTTTDSAIHLLGLGPDTSGSGALRADVTFQSNQAAGHGPKPNPNETCTSWSVAYVLTEPASADYLILSSTADHSPC